MRNRRLVWIIAVTFFAFLFYFSLRPCFFVFSDSKMLLELPVNHNEPVAIRFIHSVQKTVVLENLHLDVGHSAFVLDSTKYQSFGVGLPFLPQEGELRREGDYFILDHMDRTYPKLELRTGVGTKLTMLFREEEYPFYEWLDDGSKVTLQIAPYYKKWIYLLDQGTYSGYFDEKEEHK